MAGDPTVKAPDDLLRVAGQVVGDGDPRRRGVTDGEQHVTGGRVVVDIPTVVARERCGIGGKDRCVVVDRLHVFVGVVVPVDGVITIVAKTIGSQVAAGRHDAVVR